MNPNLNLLALSADSEVPITHCSA